MAGKPSKPGIMENGRLFFRHVLPAAIRPVYSLWHEVIGFLFIVFAALIGFAGFRTFRTFSGDPGELIKMVMAAFFVILLGGYGVSSFLRARKISRS